MGDVSGVQGVVAPALVDELLHHSDSETAASRSDSVACLICLIILDPGVGPFVSRTLLSKTCPCARPAAGRDGEVKTRC